MYLSRHVHLPICPRTFVDLEQKNSGTGTKILDNHARCSSKNKFTNTPARRITQDARPYTEQGTQPKTTRTTRNVSTCAYYPFITFQALQTSPIQLNATHTIERIGEEGPWQTPPRFPCVRVCVPTSRSTQRVYVHTHYTPHM